MNWLNEKVKTGMKVEITTKDILCDCLHVAPERINLGHTQRIGKILKSYNWKKMRTSTLPQKWYYIPPEQVEPDVWIE
jgi:hypothetical protein